MALDAPELRTATFSQMGGEGIQWVGAAPFVATPHIFQNLGDGTYQHSGLLAIRAAIVAGTNVTYKILLNDAVAMTGGQAPEGRPDPIRIARTLQAEGISALALVSDAPEKWRGRQDLPPDLEIVHRDGLDGVQKKFRTLAGASVILYEQTCASEKRKRRKRKAYPDPDRRIMINARVCEGCGDCSVQSRCIAIEPVETPYGRKRQINQSSCNKDYSCSKGFCPSFVEIAGAQLPQPAVGEVAELERRLLARVPAPSPARPDAPINIYIAGVGGAGVLTLGALLGAAAHIEGHNVTVLDFTGLAQKNGAVVSQVRIAVPTQPLAATRIGPAAVDLMIGADLVAAAAPDALVRLDCARSAAVLNLDVTPTAQIIADADAQVPVATLRKRIAQKVRADGLFEWNASRVAQETFGDPVYANVMLLGYAWQKSLIPISDAAIERAIALNGVAVELNTRAFRLGRIAAFDLHSLSGNAAATAATPEPPAIDEFPDMRAAELARYQDAQYANLYRGAVAAVRAAEQRLANTSFDLTRAAAENLFKLMAYKDEYEVARLYSNGEFESALRRQFAAVGKISVWLAPPLLSGTDPATGRPRKRRFGPWIFKIFKLLAALKGLRGTGFDPFGWTAERRLEREAVNFYLDQLALVGERLTATNYATALELLRLPERIRGFGPVKVAALQSVRIRQQQLTSQFVLPAPPAHKLGASGGRGEWAEWPDRSRSSG
jgi:indolepyruvate ferredoxin oxidoreductase